MEPFETPQPQSPPKCEDDESVKVIRDLELGVVYANLSEGYEKKNRDLVLQNIGLLSTFCQHFTLEWDITCETFHVYDVLLNLLDPSIDSQINRAVLEFLKLIFAQHSLFVDEFDMNELVRRVLTLCHSAALEELKIAIDCLLSIANHNQDGRMAILSHLNATFVEQFSELRDETILSLFWRLILRISLLKKVQFDQAICVMRLISAHWQFCNAATRANQLWITAKLKRVLNDKWPETLLSSGVIALVTSSLVVNDTVLAASAVNCVIMMTEASKQIDPSFCDYFMELVKRDESAEIGAFAIQQTILFVPDSVNYFVDRHCIELILEFFGSFSFPRKKQVIGVLLMILYRCEANAYDHVNFPVLISCLFEMLECDQSPSMFRPIIHALSRVADEYVQSGKKDEFVKIVAENSGWDVLDMCHPGPEEAPVVEHLKLIIEQ